MACCAAISPGSAGVRMYATIGSIYQFDADYVAADLRSLAENDTTLFGFRLLVQVWATR
jgi:hypothetical protein